MYNYYYHRGLIPIIGKGIVELISLFFTLWLSVFLFVYLDWRELTFCTDEHTCHDSLMDYVIEHVSYYLFVLMMFMMNDVHDDYLYIFVVVVIIHYHT